jgi:hypothetical protein
MEHQQNCVARRSPNTRFDKSTKDKVLMPVADIEAVPVSKSLRCLEIRSPVVVSLAETTC